MNINFFAPLLWVADTGQSLINNILLIIDGVIFNFVRYFYKMLVNLSKVNFFGTDEYAEITKRFYVVLGLIMLFVLAYSLLKAVINPDNFAKGEASFPKLIQNVVVSLVIIAILPTVFGLAFNVQNALLNKGTVTNIIMGNETSNDENSNDNYTYETGDNLFAFETFKGFLYPTNCNASTVEEETECRKKIRSNVFLNIPLFGEGKDALTDVDEKVKNGASFRYYAGFTQAMVGENPELEYSWPISTLVGGFILYVLANFCFDIALRSVKLAFYQIIAPIPVICRVIPGGKLKDVFSKWVKQIISLFLEVFVRIGAIAFGVKMLDLILNSDQFIALRQSLGFSLTSAIIIMAVVMFIKQIPKVLGDLFGLDTGGMKLGLREKLAAGGGLIAGGALGAAGTSLIRSSSSAVSDFKKAKGIRGKAGAVLGGTAAVLAGTGSGLIRGGNRARGAKNFADTKKAIVGGADAASAAKARRASYRAEHDSRLNFMQTQANVMWGHIEDNASRFGNFLGIGSSVQGLIDDNKLIDDIAAKKKSVANSVESVIDKEANKANSTFQVGNFSATELRNRKLAILDAQAGNLYDSNGQKISVAQAQQAFDQYRYDFSQAAQNVAFMSKDNFEKLKNSSNNLERDLYVKFSEANSNAETFRATVSKNITAPYLQQAGFTLDYLQGDMKVDAAGTPIKNMGDILDIAKAANSREIARRQQTNQSSDSNK